MSQLYVTSIDEDITDSIFNQLLLEISEDRKKQIEKYVFREDALRSLVAELLVRHILRKDYGVANRQIEFEYNQYGKPYVRGIKSFYFNLSHSGKWVVCATDCQSVGVDVEQIKPIDIQIAHRFFSDLESKDLDKQAEKDKLDYFYDIWVLKESYIKMAGKGLHIPLNSFSCRFENDCITFSTANEHCQTHFKKYDMDAEYKLAICQRNPYFSEHSENVSIETIIRENIASI